jgi:hypothetical protein
MRYRMSVTLSVAIAAMMAPVAALSCSCMPMSREQLIEMSEFAFSGRVTRTWRSRDGDFLHASVVVTRQIKGRLGPRLTVLTSAHPTMCGYALHRGRSYDFVAERAPRGMVSITSCSMSLLNP